MKFLKKQCKPWLFLSINIFAVLNLLCYFGIRSMWSGIIRYTFDSMPYILLFSMLAACLCATVMSLHKKFYLLPAILFALLGLLFFGLDAYIISLTTEASHYFIREFLYNLLYVGIIALLYCLMFVFPKFLIFRKKWLASVVLVVLFVGGLLIRFDVISFNRINCTPAVFAVEDTYQIVFTTSGKGTAWVEIDGVEYNDTYAGYRITEDRIHKVTVPMEVLDNSDSYTIYAKSMLLRGPYSSMQGKTIKKTFSWRGVRPEDGLNYYAISDVHNIKKTPVGAASYFGDDLDFLINCGDQVSWIDRTSDLEETFRMCGEITKGEIPVVYARGNHETKGVLADEFHRYVGATEEGNFYFTFRLKNIWGIVLDVGEDHADDFVEYYGAAKFDDYRDAQTIFLDEILANADTEFNAPGVDYRIAVCHIPLTIKSKSDHAGKRKDAWVERLNQMNLTILYGGHIHQLWYIDPAFEDGSTVTQCEAYSGKATGNNKRIMTSATFPAILVSRKSEGQQLTFKEYVFDTKFIGVAASSDGKQTTLRYTNEKGEVVDNIISPWFEDIQYGNQIIIENK